MKNHLLLLLLFFQLAAFSQAGKYALLVGESRDDSTPGWVNLRAYMDLQHLKTALLHQGFPDSNILLISDKDATKQKIIDAFNKHLSLKVKAGDIALFYFSGHGQRILDFDGDESDGFDEALVPVDAPNRYQKGIYEGERHLSDDDLRSLLLPLRRKLGQDGSVIVAVDACFSGSITRGNTTATARGTKTVLAPPGYRPDVYGLQLPEDMDLLGEPGKTGNSSLAPLVVFTACRDYETAFERQDSSGGIFTSAFVKGLFNGKENDTYKYLFDRICTEMADDPRQNPTMEGNGNLLVFGNTRLPEIPVYLNSKNLRIHSTQPSPADSTISLQLNIKDTTLHSSLRNAIHSVSYIRESADFAGLRISDSMDAYRLRYFIHNTNGLCLLSDSLPLILSQESRLILTQKVLECIFRYLQARNLSMTTLSCSELKPELQLVPIKETPKDPYLFEARNEFAVGDTFAFRLKIKGPAKRFAFYSILNISNGSTVALLRPSGDKSPEDFRCPLNEYITFSNWKFVFTDPGKESFLLVCAGQPVDLRPQFSEASASATRGGKKPAFNPLSGALQSNPQRGINNPKVSVVNVPVLVR
jgi:hypothetical protein